MGFVWAHADSFLHSVASPLHSFVTSFVSFLLRVAPGKALHQIHPDVCDAGLWSHSSRVVKDLFGHGL